MSQPLLTDIPGHPMPTAVTVLLCSTPLLLVLWDVTRSRDSDGDDA
jgi:hypothetical protein